MLLSRIQNPWAPPHHLVSCCDRRADCISSSRYVNTRATLNRPRSAGQVPSWLFLWQWFSCLQAQRWHQGNEHYGRSWQAGDVVGCMVDMTEHTMMFTLNGEILLDDSGSELAFKDFDVGDGKCTASCVVFGLGYREVLCSDAPLPTISVWGWVGKWVAAVNHSGAHKAYWVQ